MLDKYTTRILFITCLVFQIYEQNFENCRACFSQNYCVIFIADLEFWAFGQYAQDLTKIVSPVGKIMIEL